jgi:outer membrane lipoprotein-sorting protein
MRVAALPLLALGSWLLVGTGEAAARPAGFLRATLEADQRLSYTGIRVVRAWGGKEEKEQRVRVFHLAPNRTRIEYLSPGPGNILLESGGGRWFYARDRDRWRSIEWRAPRSHVGLLLRNYRVREEGEGTVAGRRVIQLVIEPRHPGNPSKRVWIDPSYRITLKEEVRDYQGRLIAASAFEQFELVRDLPASLFEPPAAAVARAPVAADLPPTALPFAPLRPRYLPPGYREVRESALNRGPSQGVHLRYTDGLGTISLFQFRREPGAAPARKFERDGERPSRRSGRSGGRPRLGRQIGDLHCRAMGDIDPDELRKLLDSLPDRP